MKKSNVSKAVEGNTPAEPDKSRDMATVDSETNRYKIEKTEAVMEMNRDIEMIEADKVSNKSSAETNTQ